MKPESVGSEDSDLLDQVRKLPNLELAQPQSHWILHQAPNPTMSTQTGIPPLSSTFRPL